MIWINGRLSWPLVLAIVYASVIVIATDTIWRLVEAPIAVIAGGSLAVMAIGVVIILRAGARRTAIPSPL